MPSPWPPYLQHVHHAVCMVTAPCACTPFLEQGLHAFRMVCVPFAWPPCLLDSHQVFSMVTISFGMVTNSLAWRLCLWQTSLWHCSPTLYACLLLLAFLALFAFLAVFCFFEFEILRGPNHWPYIACPKRCTDVWIISPINRRGKLILPVMWKKLSYFC